MTERQQGYVQGVTDCEIILLRHCADYKNGDMWTLCRCLADQCRDLLRDEQSEVEALAESKYMQKQQEKSK